MSLCQLTFPSEGLRGLQGLAGTRWVLGWRVLPPLQTGQHDEVGTVLQPRQFYGQPGEEKRRKGTSDEPRGMICGQSSIAVSGETAEADSGLDRLGFSPRI